MLADWAWAEMESCGLNDPRRRRTGAKVLTALARRRGVSFSAALGGLRQAAGDLYQDPKTETDDLLKGHREETWKRCAAAGTVLIAQDTTYFMYRHQVDGLVSVNGSDRSKALLSHGALAMTTAGVPLGMLHLEMWGADAAAPAPPLGPPRAREDRESFRWTHSVQRIGAALPEGVRAVLLQDREADIYQVLSEDRPAQLDLVVRAVGGRKVVVATGRAGARCHPTGVPRMLLTEAAEAARLLGRYQVALPARGGAPPRTARMRIRACDVWVIAPASGDLRHRPPCRYALVYAVEVGAPAGATPLRWLLLTTQRVRTARQAKRVVDQYKLRWGIERLHYTLKSGLGAEKLQLDDSHSLQNLLALYYITAWRIMLMTYTAREHPEAPATEIFEPVELEVLSTVTQRPTQTMAQAVLAIAVLGGFEPYPKSGPPGVKSLWLGYSHLSAMTAGWRACMAKLRDPTPTQA